MIRECSPVAGSNTAAALVKLWYPSNISDKLTLTNASAIAYTATGGLKPNAPNTNAFADTGFSPTGQGMTANQGWIAFYAMDNGGFVGGDIGSSDSNTSELSYQYKTEERHQFQVAYFNEKYVNTPVINNDTSSDNRGFKLQGTLNKKFDDQINGYLKLGYQSKKYPKSSSRTDKKPDLSVGLEYEPMKDFLINPDFSYAKNSSSSTTYSYSSYGPGLTISYIPFENIEIISGYSRIQTNYSDRTFQQRVGPRTINVKEEQTLSTFDAELIYTVLSKINLSINYSKVKNESNNKTSSTQEYESDDVRFGISFSY